MNADDITSFLGLYTFVAIVVSIFVANALEKRLKARTPATRPYRWGFYCGCMGIACAPLALLAGLGMLVAAMNSRWEAFGYCLALTVFSTIDAVSGWFVIQRKRWAWVVSTIFSCNIFSWIINYIYGRNRWGEFVGEPYAGAEAAAAYELLADAAKLEAQGRVQEALAAYQHIADRYSHTAAGNDAKISIENLIVLGHNADMGESVGLPSDDSLSSAVTTPISPQQTPESIAEDKSPMNDNSEKETDDVQPPPENVSFIKTLCPVCDGSIEFPADALGQEADCPHCHKTFVLGSVTAPAQPEKVPSALNQPPPPVNSDYDSEEAEAIKDVFDYPLCIGPLIAGVMSFAVLAANIIGVVSAFVWLLWLKQWLALGVGIAVCIAGTFIASILLLPSIGIASPALLFIKTRGKFLAVPFMLLSSACMTGAMVGWGALVIWWMPRLGIDKAFVPLLIWSYEVATIPWASILKTELRLRAHALKPQEERDGGLAVFHISFFSFGYIIAVLARWIWDASTEKAIWIIFWFNAAAFAYSNGIALWRMIRRWFRRRNLADERILPIGGSVLRPKTSELVFWCLLLGITVLIALIAIPNFVKARATSQANACINNLRQLDGAAAEFALENEKKEGDAINFPDDLKLYIKLNSNGEIPGCPAGGFYSVKRVGEKPTCSLGTNVVPAHILPQ